ncbi:MAG: hypothetical protein AAFV53_23865, partial [Myxococcota bacterium]
GPLWPAHFAAGAHLRMIKVAMALAKPSMALAWMWPVIPGLFVVSLVAVPIVSVVALNQLLPTPLPLDVWTVLAVGGISWLVGNPNSVKTDEDEQKAA